MSENQKIAQLFNALQSGETAFIEEILQSDPSLVNLVNEDGLTPLGFAAHFGQKEAVQILLSMGAEINAVSHSKISFIPSNTALHAAIAGERNLEVINLLLEQGASTNIMDSNGQTCLHTAAFHDDHVPLIELLIKYGAHVGEKTMDGKTALDIAVARGHNQVADYLKQGS